jgi:hypothetical protein
VGIFRKLFGPNQGEIWNELARQLGGSIVSQGFWNGQVLEARSGEWVVTLDEYAQMVSSEAAIPHTRLRAPFPNPSGFWFSIHRSSIFTPLGKLVGMKDIEIGDMKFDDEFVIKGNDESLVRLLFRNARLRK